MKTMKKGAFIISFILITVFIKGQNQDISFESGKLTLYGTLAVPTTGFSENPVVIFIHGSGPMDRDITIPLKDQNSSCLFPDIYGDTIRIFKDISEHLYEKGIASFRYDKRTLTHGKELDVKEISPYDFIADAISAVNFVKEQMGIDKDNIFILGHSQGTNFLPYVAKQCQVKGLINLACLARPIDSLYAEQIRYIISTCADSNQAETYYIQYQEIFYKIRNNTWDNNIPIDGVYPKFWKDWIGITDSSLMKYQGISEKVLFLQGTDDFNVTPDNALIYSNNLSDNAEVRFFPDLNHFFTTSTDAHVNSVMLDTISNWIGQINKTTAVNNQMFERPEITKFNDHITVSAANDEIIQHTYLYDLHGRMIKYFNKSNPLFINIHNCDSRFVILKIVTNKSIFVEKIVL